MRALAMVLVVLFALALKAAVAGAMLFGVLWVAYQLARATGLLT